MRRLSGLFLLVVAVAALSACGGDEEATGPASDYCQQLRKTADDAVKPNTTTSAKDAAALAKAQEDEFNRILTAIVDKAPAELEDDYAAFKAFVDLRFELTRNPAMAQSQPERIKEIQEKYTPAAKAISEYNTSVCKFQTTTSSAGAATTVATTPTTAASVATTTSR